MTKINGETRIIGFFGSTYRTSKMYAMYNAAFEALELNYLYIPFIVQDLAKAVEGVRHLGVQALGVTIPYKIEILPYLDELDSDARRIGAVNAVVNSGGRLIGANTDGKGAVRALQEATPIAGKNVVLLGAGGAARALAFAIADAGGHLVIVNRTSEAARTLAGAVGCRCADGERLAEVIGDAHIVINATSVGMAPHAAASPLGKELLRPELTVMDLVSNPRETQLLRHARERGCSVVYGERMLFWQGVLKFQLYTGVEPPLAVMEAALRQG
jgi:shikimate dehydrogenase